MNLTPQNFTLLMVNDDEDTCILTQQVIQMLTHQETRFHLNFRCVETGLQLVEYLEPVTPHNPTIDYPQPDLILLDLNMPAMNGIETLMWLKQNPKFSKIPVVIFSSSDHPDDIKQCYELGANCYIRKPLVFESFINILQSIVYYWFNIVQLPSYTSPDLYQIDYP
ncbi:response regulator [Spirulina subsalsa FACHB-351]|uniref:Response regulator n=1 Tax=Spirulina subsalsa FACHB-351 TaxID=234711 RepID=A0ABT3L8J4_9CYAN|nr:response regulator [Spirulina subsalsa]MCW6037837.1 response regulator [Spirulina subsalsa FACHB-351]